MEIDRLEIIMEAEARKATAQLDILIKKLEQASSLLPKFNNSGVSNIASGLKQFGKSVETLSSFKATDFNRITKGIEKLGSINNSAIYTAGNSLRNFANSIQSIGSVSDDAVKLGTIASGISKLGGASIQRAAATLPQLSIALREFMATLSTAPNVSENIISMTNAMANLASNGAKFSSTVNGLSRAAKTLSRSNNEASNSFKLFGRSAKDSSQSIYTLTHHINSLVGAYFSLKFVIGSISSGIKKSMDFVETINLFQTSYKKIGMEDAQDVGMAWGSESADAYAKTFIDRAQTFNNNLTNALGLDPNTMMNYQAVFAQISNSLGLTTGTVENVSESFTMLGNDIASLWNTDTKSAMEKLQAGLIGQVRPLRELGIDTSQATLQLTAYKYGIMDSVTKMTQAEKVQLRYLAIMDQSSVAFGDMAKTINSPANELRILKQQFENLSRSIGNVFMKAVSTVLPYINGVVMALRNMIDTLATALGYEAPDYSDSNIYTDVTGDILDTTDATDDATAANERYKKSLLGIDDMNILSKPASSSGSGASSKSGGSGNSKLDDAINDKTASYMKKFNEQLEGMKNKSKEIAENIKKFFKNIAEKAGPAIQAFKDLWEKAKPFNNNIGEGLKWFYDNVLEPMSTIVISETIPDVLYAMSSALGLLNTVTDKFKENKGKDTILGFLISLQESKLKDVSNWFKKIGDAFTALSSFIKKPNWKDILDYVGNVFSISAKITGFPDIPQLIKNWGGDIKDIVVNIRAKIATKWEDISGPWSELMGHFAGKTTKIIIKIAQTWNDLKGPFMALTDKFVGKTVKFVVNIPQTWNDLKDKYSNLAGHFVGKIVNFSVTISQVWNDLKTKFHNLYDNFIGKVVEFKVVLTTAASDIKAFINSIIDSVNTNIIAKLKIDSGFLHISVPPIPPLATGGFPEDGLFFANHNELVGQFSNGKTAVANNAQITAGIEEASYRGFMRAFMEAGGGSQPIIVESSTYFGDEVVHRAVKRASKDYDERYHVVATV